MDDAELDLLLSGDLNSLVALPKRVVRLFISSTFTDMTLERNSLMERVYPRLKKFCREKHGLDFQVVDMRWGVRDEATDDHQTVDLCSREIANCQRLSLGPNFVAFIGDKYGFRPLPNRINSTEFRSLRRSLIELDVNSDFLDTWYREDLNSVPSEHVLQPISSILKNFTNKAEPELQLVDQRIWQAIQERLHELLMLGSSRLVSQGRMSASDQLMRYSISVTEREVIEGCLDVGEAKLRCLVYVRSIVDLREHVADCLEQVNGGSGAGDSKSQSQLDTTSSGHHQDRPITPNGGGGSGGGDSLAETDERGQRRRRSSALRKASLKIGDDLIQLTTSKAQTVGERRLERNRRLLGRYIDLLVKDDHWQVDAGAQEALAELRAGKLRRKLNPNGRNLNVFEVHWNELDGLSPKSEEHKQYLNELNEHFYSNLTRMIRNAVKNEQSRVKTSGLVGEVLQHSHYARQVGDSLRGRQAELAKLRGYIVAGHSSDGGGGGDGDDGDDEPSPGLPMFVYGVGGSGKTSVLARAATLARQWILASKRSTSRRRATPDGEHRGEPKDHRRSTGGQAHEARRVEAADWSQMPCVIMRFCCTTPSSSSMGGVLTSVCRQLQYNFYQFGPLNGLLSEQQVHHPDAGEAANKLQQPPQLPYRPIPEDFVRLVFTFRRLLDNCGHPLHSGRQFVIFLDSIDRLSSATADATNLELRYSWLTSLTHLPPNVRLIVSCSSDSHPASGNPDYLHLKRHFVVANYVRRPPGQLADSLGAERDSSEQRISESPTERDSRLGRRANNCWLLHVQPLGPQLATEILARWLADSGRNLSQQQWSIVEKSFARCSRPMFVKLALGEVINWKSYSMQGDAKGLTFGSSWLAEGQSSPANSIDAEADGADGDANDPVVALSRLVRARELQEAEEQTGAHSKYKWTLLSLEQQWLNYLDYVQKVEEQSSKQTQQLDADQTIVIQIGANKSGLSKMMANGAPGGTNHLGGGATSAILCHLSDTIEDAICQLFARIELQHGYLLTKHSLSYITAARNGIGENELEDILSLDDVVLDDVFQYHLPPVRRIPPLLWTRLRNDLPNFLTERDSDGIVVAWHHGQFQTVTRGRYLADARQLAYIHSIMADYFLGRWADKPKPFRCTKQQIQMAAEQLESAIQSSIRDSASQPTRGSLSGSGGAGGGRLGSGSAATGQRANASFSVRHRLRSSDQHSARFQWMQAKADRRVPSQPLYYTLAGPERSPSDRLASRGHQSSGGESEGRTETDSSSPPRRRRYNLRKLTELPHHLLGSRRFAELAQLVLFNYNWLHATLSSLGLQTLFADFDEASKRLEAALAELRAETQSAEGATGGPTTGHKLGAGDQASEPPPAGQSEDRTGREQQVDCGQLESIIRQLSVLSNTLRLASSIVHSESQMLAPQLIGRLVSIAGQHVGKQSTALATRDESPGGQSAQVQQTNNEYLAQLIGQCDLDGSSDCALLPIGQCLQPADGLQSSSLEGHPFGVMSMAITADQRNLLAVSSKFIMWNMATGELVRDIDPKLEGSIILEVVMSRNSELAFAYTSDNLVLVLDIITQQVSKYRPPIGAEQILGLRLLGGPKARRFFVWTRLGWSVLRVEEGGGEQQPAGWPSSRQDRSSRIAIRLDYCIDLMDELALVDSELVEVWIDSTGTGASFSPVDLAIVLLRDKTASNGELELLTIELIVDRAASKFVSLFVWRSRLQSVTCLALSEDLLQLVYSDPLGNVYLCRRRQLGWSKAKQLSWSAELQEGVEEEKKDCLAGSCNAEIELVASNSNSRASPISIELECGDNSPWTAGNSANDLFEDPTAGGLQELAQFEARLDGDCAEIEAPGVFGRLLADCERSSDKLAATRRHSRRRHSRPIEFVKLHLRDRLVVVKLKTAGKPVGPRTLWLPRSLCNVRLAPNRSQLASVIMQTHLVASIGKRMLIYSMESGQLLKCFGAHNSRITELRPILAVGRYTKETTTTTAGNQSDNDNRKTPANSMSVVTCSLDKTVRVWNLLNIHNDTKAIARTNNPIEALKVASQGSFAVSLGRNELALWDWQTLDILQRMSVDEFAGSIRPQHDDRLRRGDDSLKRITCCKFSQNGQLLVVASSQVIALFAIESKGAIGHRQARGQSSDDESSVEASRRARLRPIFRHQLPVSGLQSVLRIRLTAKDSRLIVISRRKNIVSASSSSSSAASQSNGVEVADGTGNESQETNSDTLVPEPSGCGRIITDCYSIPDGRLLWSMAHKTPIVQSNGDNSNSSDYLAKRTTSDRHRAIDTQRGKQGHREARIRLPTISSDQQFLVCVESKDDDDDNSGPSISSGSLLLQLYSIRDGQLARSIDLGRLLVVGDQQLGTSNHSQQSVGIQTKQQQHQQLRAPSVAEAGSSRSKPLANKSAGISSTAIGCNQFTRLKAVSYFERQTIIALINDLNGTGFLVDTSSRQLIACLSDWSGRISSDGRYGLTRMIRTSGPLAPSGISMSGYKSSAGRPDHPLAVSGGGGAGAAAATSFGADNGLQLVELRHGRPVRSLLTLDQLRQLASVQVGGAGGSSQWGPVSLGDGEENACNFTRPNNDYVYYYDARLCRLLLIRVRDSQVLANYKSSVAVNRIKCSPDGMALILGLADGSLVSLAIVDAQTSETLHKLAQYPTRRRLVTKV